MPSTTVESLNRITFDGPIGYATLVPIGLALLMFFGWLLWRERNILGAKLATFFFLLRAAALVTVLWMLMAPTQQRSEVSTTRKTLAVATDISGSMRTVDPVGTADDLRWRLAMQPEMTTSSVAHIDQARVSLETAHDLIGDLILATEQHLTQQEIAQQALLANKALEALQQSFQSASTLAANLPLDAPTANRLERLQSQILNVEFETFTEACRALQKGRQPNQQNWDVMLPDLQLRLGSLRAPLNKLADDVLLAESSHPQEQSDQFAQHSRLQRVSGVIEHLSKHHLDRIREEALIRGGQFAETYQTSPELPLPAAQRTEDETNRQVGTNLIPVFESLTTDQETEPVAGLVLFTDMGHNAAFGEHLTEFLKNQTDVPVYVVPIGNTQYVRDLNLASVSAPGVALRNDSIIVEATVIAYDCQGEICTVKLMRDGELIDAREIPIDAAVSTHTVQFEQQVSTIGIERFQLVVTPLDGELTEVNNYDEFEVNVTRNEIHVLVADNLPRWEYRYLTQLFRRDPKIQCDELLFHPRLIATGNREATKSLPVTAEEWDQYDVVILGDLPTDVFSHAAQESLEDYLRQRGGTLILIAGQDAMPEAFVDHPLEELLPVSRAETSSLTSPNGYAFRVTEEGRNHQALMIAETDEATRTAWDFVNKFAPLPHISNWRIPKPTAHQLIAAIPKNTADEQAAISRNAFLCWQPIGRGKSLYLSGPETYRLRFLRGDQLHYRFWGQLLRWSVASGLSIGGELAAIRTDKARYDSGESVLVTVKLNPETASFPDNDDFGIQVTTGENSRTVKLNPLSDVPGEYQAELRDIDAEVYRIEPVGAVIEEFYNTQEIDPISTGFTVLKRRPEELIDTRCDLALAHEVAELTGGQVIPPTALGTVLELMDLTPIVTETVERTPLWIRWEYLWLVFGCLQLEWIVRKWKGLS